MNEILNEILQPPDGILQDEPSGTPKETPRWLIYLLFSRFFHEPPDASLLKEIGGESLSAESIAVEYTSLFVVAGESYVPPYESYYCDTLSIDISTACSPYFEPDPIPEGMKGFVGGPSAARVRKFYEENGFALNPDFHDLADHVACELELMGRLYQDGCVDQARDFFQNHLGRWVFTFLGKLEEQKCSLFFQNVALNLKEFLKQEASEPSPPGEARIRSSNLPLPTLRRSERITALEEEALRFY